MEKWQEKQYYNPASSFAKRCGVWKAVTVESIRQPQLACQQLARVSEYLQKFPALTVPRRAKIARVCKKLQTHVQEVDEALARYRLLVGLTFGNKGFAPCVLPDVDTDGKPLTTDEVCDLALALMDEARERALRAEITNAKLINELAILCPATSNPYKRPCKQSTRKTTRPK